jgi:adenosylcobinamide-phosphate synthase
MSLSRATGIALGYLADQTLGDPARWHPVAGFGRLAAAGEGRADADSRLRGGLVAGALVGSTATAGLLLDRATRQRPVVHLVLTAAATWTVLGGSSLDREAGQVEALLGSGDLPAARGRLRHLVGRTTDGLDSGEVARAAVESVAENTSDAVVAPLLLGAVGGVGALLGYRAANTLDAMFGHRSPRYQRFGWAAARLDDVLNLPGARLTAILAALLAPTVGGSTAESLRVWRRDSPRHPSPNAGPVEGAFAGALGVRLGGTNDYHGRVEHRVQLGRGREPRASDIGLARTLARRVDTAAVLLAMATPLGLRARR